MEKVDKTGKWILILTMFFALVCIICLVFSIAFGAYRSNNELIAALMSFCMSLYSFDFSAKRLLDKY